ncbi:MAG: four helix bundle protein [Salinivirgaceae bacterium]|jgi:four helix bundle protein|nr:four helix bundle protein [Salinivirgaceae bacterium]
MSSYRDLDIYKMAYDLAIKVHHMSLKLPKHELYEQGSQVRRSTKSIKDTIVEGYGRRKYKADFIKFLIYAQASCDEATSQLTTINELYSDIAPNAIKLLEEYKVLGAKINKFIQYVELNWKT